MFESKEEKKRKQTRERVQRYREKKKQQTETVTNEVTPVTESKMICKGQYFKTVDGKLVCVQCGKTPKEHGIKDKIKRGVEFK